MTDVKEGLLADLEAEEKRMVASARKHYGLGVTAVILSILSSAVAGALGFIEAVPREIAAAIALLPGVCLTLYQSFRLGAKADWFYRKQMRLRGLKRQLRYEGADPVEVSKRFSVIDESMELEFPLTDESIWKEAITKKGEGK
jgi:hypothetical protein